MNTFEQLMKPVWNSEIIYDESLTMVRNHTLCEAPLLFEPAEVLSVTSADKLQKYEEGRDWILKGNQISISKSSRIFSFDEEELVFDIEHVGDSFRRIDGKYSLFKEGHFFHDRQIAVTYRKAAGTIDFTPQFCGHDLPRTMSKLYQKKSLRVVLFGDSIAAGANSSGMTVTTPFLPPWGNLFVENLRRHYSTEVKFFNSSVGGMNSYWGLKNAESKVAGYKPDLAIIAFGMNDHDRGNVFAENIRKIIKQVKEASPQTEFVLCATTVPNQMVEGFYYYQDEHLGALKKLETEGVIVADFYSMHKALMSRKRFIDMTGNNLNHPNDFLIRCHAQVLSAMFICNEETREGLK